MLSVDWKRVFLPLHIWTVVIAVVLDQITKYWVIFNLREGVDRISVWAPWFEIVHIKNPGAAWGFLADSSGWVRLLVFGAVTIFCIIFILHELSQATKEMLWYRFGLSLILGGAFGNLKDRAIFQEVTDFIAVRIPIVDYDYPRFNIADSAITVGVAIIVLAVLIGSFQKKKSI